MDISAFERETASLIFRVKRKIYNAPMEKLNKQRGSLGGRLVVEFLWGNNILLENLKDCETRKPQFNNGVALFIHTQISRYTFSWIRYACIKKEQKPSLKIYFYLTHKACNLHLKTQSSWFDWATCNTGYYAYQ